jgi:uncharacterized protein (DUF1697 family)
MNTYIALFRGINVGGNNILPMKELSKILEKMGCEKVRTYIQSGNVVFQTKETSTNKLADDISAKVFDQFDFKPKVLLLGIEEFHEAINNCPFKTNEGKMLHFFFLDTHAENAKMDKILELKSNTEEIKLHEKVFYLYAPDGIGRSKLAAKVEQSLGVPATARNWNTVSKLISLASSEI